MIDLSSGALESRHARGYTWEKGKSKTHGYTWEKGISGVNVGKGKHGKGYTWERVNKLVGKLGKGHTWERVNIRKEKHQNG